MIAVAASKTFRLEVWFDELALRFLWLRFCPRSSKVGGKKNPKP